MQNIRKSFLLGIIALFIFTSVIIVPSYAQSPQPPDEPNDLAMLEAYTQITFPTGDNADLPYSPNLDPDLLAKAEPDECFNGIGQPYSGTVSLGCSDSPIFNSNTQPKVNQAYVWGLTQSGDDLWFGTAPNTHCMVMGGFLGFSGSIQTDSFVCEFGNSSILYPVPPEIGDWRPPDGFRYDISSDVLYDIHPANFPNATIQDAQRFTATLGIRSAGTYHGPITDTVILAGPALSVDGGLNLFAYNADTTSFISSTTNLSYTNIRKWVDIDGELYTGVRKDDGTGAVLKYIGDPTDPAAIFDFEEVGLIPSEVAELAYHDGRLFITTWPSWPNPGDPGQPVPATLWMSPDIPPGGLTELDQLAWIPVWTYPNYDPNPFTAATTGGGALMSFDGYLYWGTMHVPFMATAVQMQLLPPDPMWDNETTISYLLSSVMGNHRAISIFRGRDFGLPTQDIELLYGESELPAYVNNSWVIVPNNMGETPAYGGSGFDNFFNNYTWTMSLLHDELYVGTMDWSYLAADSLTEMLESIFSAILGTNIELPPGVTLPLPDGTPGADLWRFTNTVSPAEPIHEYGVGNHTNYGIRTMLTSPDDRLFLGSANPMNLLTNPPDDFAGGWELIEMVEIPQRPDLTVEKYDSYAPLPVPPGSIFTYTIEVTNLGYYTATNVRVNDTLPSQVIYNNGNPDCVETLPGELTCYLGEMLPYDGITPDVITTQISVTAPSEPTWLYNEVFVTNNYGDEDWSDNESSLGTMVDYTSDFAITKTTSQASVLPGDLLTYTLTISNNGPDDLAKSASLLVTKGDGIFIPSTGTASPYPSEMVELSGVKGVVDSVRVTLHGLTHVRTSDLHIMLVSPENTKVMLMSEAGGGLNFNSDLELVFDDEADYYLPQITGIISGTWKPTYYSGLDPFPLPAPIGPISDTLSAFEGEDPNGTWELYVFDSNLLYSGQIDDGWTLDLTLKRNVTVEDYLPEGLILIDTIAHDWDCADVLGIPTCTRDSFLVDESSQIELVTVYDFIDSESISNVAEVSSAVYDPVPGNNIAEVNVIIKKIYELWFPVVFKLAD